MRKVVKPFFKQNEFTQVSNVIFDVLLPRVSANEFKVLALIIRKTTGWHKEFDELSLSQIKTLTGIKTNATVAAAIRGLEKMGVILVDRPDLSDPARCRGSNIYSLNLELKLEIEVEENYLGLSIENEIEGGSSKIEQGVVQKLNNPSSKIERPPVQKLNTQNKEDSLNKESKQRGVTAPPIPPAIKAYQEVTNRYPSKVTWGTITQTVGGEPERLAFWKEVITTWIGCGFNPNNVTGMLDCFSRNELPTTKKTGGSSYGTKNPTRNYRTGPAVPPVAASGLGESFLEAQERERGNA